MKVVVSGASGLIGSAIVPHLESRGHKIVRLVRRAVTDPSSEVHWNPHAGFVDIENLQGADVIINLAGENIGSGIWTKEKKQEILRSRVDGTRLLAESLGGLNPPPKLLLSASAYGYYGNTGETVVDESSPPGTTWLAEVCRQWEEATHPASDAGVRVVVFRMGVVISRKGGVLGMTSPIFRLGLGGKLGNGTQYMSWVTREDIARAMEYFITNEQIHGPVNLTAPQPITNAEFTRAIGESLHRPTLFTVPEFVLRKVLGQMAEEMLLASCRAIPARLTESGFRFKHVGIKEAVASVLSRND